MLRLLKFMIAGTMLLSPIPAAACDDDANIRGARLALPSDESLNFFNAGEVLMIAPDECSGGLYLIVFPDLLKKAEDGDVKAMDQVGLMLSAGAGVKQDWKKATKWLEKAATAGSGEANFRLGLMSQFGLGKDIDLDRAMENYMIASGKSVAWATTNIGVMHFQGIGRPKNMSEGVRFFELAHQQGDHTATQNLASIYAQGLEGVARDESRAFTLAREAAAQTNVHAMRLLGHFYANAIGIEQNLRSAYIWSSLAGKKGDKAGEQLAERIRAVLSAERLAEGDKAAAACAASDYKNCD